MRSRTGTAGALVLGVLGWMSVLVNIHLPKIKKEHLVVWSTGDSRARGARQAHQLSQSWGGEVAKLFRTCRCMQIKARSCTQISAGRRSSSRVTGPSARPREQEIQVVAAVPCGKKQIISGLPPGSAPK